MLEDDILTRVQAAKFLGVSTRTIDRYVAQEKFSVIRENGKVLFNRADLEDFRNAKNPVIAQVIKSPSVQRSSEEVKKYKILYEEAKQDLEKRDVLIQQMHYKLGSLEANEKNMVPILEAQTEKREMEEVIDTLGSENVSLSQQLKKAEYGRTFFFFLSLVFLITIGAIFTLNNLEFLQGSN